MIYKIASIFDRLIKKIIQRYVRRLKGTKKYGYRGYARGKIYSFSYPLTFERQCMRNGSRRARVERSRSPRNPRALTIVSRSRTRKKGLSTK